MNINPEIKHPEFSAATKFLHWSIAGIVLVILLIAAIIAYAPKFADSLNLLSAHIYLGVIVLLLSFFRIFWRLIHFHPSLAGIVSKSEQIIAETVYFLLYLLLILIPLSGIILCNYNGIMGLLSEFHLPQLVTIRYNAITRIMLNLHQNLSLIFIGLLTAHIGAALFHKFFYQNIVWQRMAITKKPGKNRK